MDAEDREQRISEICEAFAKQLGTGGDTDFSIWVTENPDLQLELSRRLDMVLTDWKATNDANNDDEDDQQSGSDERNFATPPEDPPNSSQVDPKANEVTHTDRRRARRIQCPHCGIGLQLVDNTNLEVICRGCGSSIPVDPNRTRTFVPLTEQKIGRFTLLSILGEGAFGTVYKAWDSLADRSVAIKIPRDGYFETSSERQRFLREAQNAGKLEHDNIVRVYEVDEAADGLPFIVSQLIDGMTLADYSNSRQLEYRQSAEIMIPVCEAVHFAHSRNIIHRDLKPSNILLNHDLRPFVTDFGLARLNEAEMTMTFDGEILGTPAYMSPEQAEGLNSELKGTSDIYSLGVILYRLLTGSLPFRGSQRMLLNQVLSEDPKPLRSFNDQIPRDLETITLKAMDKEPNRRYDTAAELGTDLQRWLNYEPILARPISRSAKLVRWCRRRPAIASLLASIFALLLVVCVLSILWGTEQSKRAASMKESNTRLIRTFENEGQNLLEQDDLLRSLTWFIEALHVDPDKDARHRLRLGMIFNQCPKLSQLSSVEAAITTLAVSADGKKIAVGDANGTVTIFDADNGLRLHTLSDHQSAMRNLRFVDNDRNVVSQAINDNYAVLWDVSTGQRIARLEHGDSVRDVKSDANGNFVFTVAWDGTTSLWDAKSGRKNNDFSIEDRRFKLACVSSNGKKVAAVSISYNEETNQDLKYWVSVWEAETGELKYDQQQTEDVSRLILNAQATEFIIVSKSGQISFLNPESGKETRSVIKTSGAPVDASYFGDESQLLTVTENGTQSIWQLTKDPEVSLSRNLGNGNVKRFVIGNQERLIASVHADGSTHVHFVNLDSLVCCPLPNDDLHPHVAIHPDGRRIISGNASGVIRIWDLASTQAGQTHLLHSDDVNWVANSPDGERIVTVSDDSTARMWNADDGRPIGKPMQHELSVFRAVFNADGSRLVTVSTDKTANLWNGFTGVRFGEQLQHKSSVVRMAWHPHLDQLATCTAEGEIALWKTGSNQSFFETNYDSRVLKMVFSPDGKFLIVGFLDGTLISIDLESQSVTKRETHEGQSINVVRFMPDASTLMTGGSDAKIRFWNPTNLIELKEPLEHLSPVRGLDIRADLSIVAADGSGRMTLWQPSNSSWQRSWVKQLDGTILERIRFHPNKRFAGVTGSSSSLNDASLGRGFAGIYDTVSQMAVSPKLKHFDRVEEIVFDPDGEYAVTCSDDDSAIIWSLATCDLEINHLRNLSVLHSSQQFDENDRLVGIGAKQLETMFRDELGDHPASFRCSEEEILNWEKWIDRVIATAQTQTK